MAIDGKAAMPYGARLPITLSVVTDVMLWSLILRTFKLPSPALLRRVNAELQSEIAERRQAEAALRKSQDTLEETVRQRTAELTASEEKYRTLIECANDAVFIHEIKQDGTPGPFVEVNDLACRRLGYSREELTRLSPMELDDPRYRDRISRVMEQVFKDGHAVFETAQMAKDGRSIPVEVSTRLLELQGRRFLFSLVRDIAERKRAEQEFRERETLYRSLVTAMDEGICVQTANGEVVAVNPAAERIQGRPSEKILGRIGDDMQGGAIYEDGRPFPGKLHPAKVTLRTGEPQKDVVMGIHRPDGTLAWISINSQPLIADGESAPYAVVTTFHDITERRRNGEELASYRHRYRQHLLELVEEKTAELRSSETRFAFLFQNMQEGLAHCRLIFAYDIPVDFEFIEVNPAFETVTGLHDVVGRRISELVPDYARDNGGSLEIIAGVVRTGVPAHWEEDLLPLNRWFSLGAYRPAAGEFALIIENITERRRALADLLASENRLRLAKIATGLGIFDWDIVTGVGQLDEQASAFLGIPLGEPITCEQLIEAVYPDDRANVRSRINLAYDPLGNGEYHAEYRVISRADGSVRQVEANGQTFFEGGHAVRFIGTVKDISEQKRLEKEVQERRAEMELLAKQQVAAQTAVAIAHELNQPLVSISAYSEAALRILRSGSKKPEKLEHALEGAMEQSQRAGRTLHELLDFLHKGEAPSERVDLNEVVHDALAIATEGGYGRFTPVLDLEPTLPLVLANRLQLQKVVVNLLHNGVEAMRGAGLPDAAITITVRTVAERNLAQVTVQDSGTGLDAETIHRIFEPFFTTKPSGVGLGLAISRALVEAYGGQLWADLEAGPGATFHFTVPFAT
jgi:two-component system sensor kinase FixL